MRIVHPVILCGGSGTRLWPLSTPERPKQFLALTSPSSLIEETAERFAKSDTPDLSFASLMVIGSERHANLLAEKLPSASKVLEPFGRNSAPAVAAACLSFKADDLVLILPADHDIRDLAAFHKAIHLGAIAASSGAIVTFGIEPTHAATGYGYIKSAAAPDANVLTVEKFVEKPNASTAQSYLDAGGYFWNAGIFIFKAGIMQQALEKFTPEIVDCVKDALQQVTETDAVLDASIFIDCPDISIDYAVMERAENVKTVPVDMGWSDVGGYRALRELLTNSERENYTSGPVTVQNSEGLYVRSEGPNVAVNGVSNLVIVATPKEVMITPTSDDGAAKALGKMVQTQGSALAVDETFSTSSKTWLWSLFDYWTDRVWDDQSGGFVEQVTFDGEPDLKSARRVRVQARQIFSFSRAKQFGWANQKAALRHIANGLEYLDTKLRHPNGGWVHIVDKTGTAIDSKRDLYDHAFIILAGAAAFEATKDDRALKIANDALDYINTNLKDIEGGGWFEDDQNSLPRRANPHMHLLEASCALYKATGKASALAVAKECVSLFETRLFDARADILGELFGLEWSPDAPTIEQTVFEVGHLYEWASLLSDFESLTGHDTLSWRRRLIRRGDMQVKNAGTGFAKNAERLDGVEVIPGGRLWPQLEMFRAHLLHPEIATSGTPERVFSLIKSRYLEPAPIGLWIDELDSSGKPCSRAVPASMLYHFVTALEPLLK